MGWRQFPGERVRVSAVLDPRTWSYMTVFCSGVFVLWLYIYVEAEAGCELTSLGGHGIAGASA